jgi:GTP cyclohydrolase I
MNAPDCFFLPDIQARADLRQLAIHKVGVKGLRYPLALLDAAGKVQHTVAELSMAVGLPPEVKGTHMSRFVGLAGRRRARRSTLPAPAPAHLTDAAAARCASTASIELAFTLFQRKARRSAASRACSTTRRLIVRQRVTGSPRSAQRSWRR